MTRFILAAGVAALAITVPAASAPGDRGERGKERAAQSQKAERGEKARAQRSERRQAAKQKRSNASADRSERRQAVQQRTERGQASERRAQRTTQAREQRAERSNRVREQRANRAESVGEQRVQVQRRDGRDRIIERRANVNVMTRERQNRQLARIAEQRGFQLDSRATGNNRQLARLAERNVIRVSDWKDLARSGFWLDGCPPGLAIKPVACVPPGQVKNLLGQPVRVLSERMELRELPSRLRYIYRDTDDYYYRYGNGYAYRVNRTNDLVSALLPLFGLGLTVGQPFPTAYSNHYMPTRLQSFYPDSQYTSYRYANGYVYEIDPMTGMIVDVDPMLGYGYGYGQMMPATYSAYNVPYQYRPFYQDTSSAYYRYAPGAIYQVDPTTSLITAVAALLTGGMTVGQPMPVGYSAYNVPYQYRANYYDTPNDWYRYSNGNIYRVDPTTQLVTALVTAALT
ncbi:MAG: hypothetical protein ACR2JJ_01035 [Sphingomicrobium sp.]